MDKMELDEMKRELEKLLLGKKIVKYEVLPEDENIFVEGYRIVRGVITFEDDEVHEIHFIPETKSGLDRFMMRSLNQVVQGVTVDLFKAGKFFLNRRIYARLLIGKGQMTVLLPTGKFLP